jgi:hypothetical protein
MKRAIGVCALGLVAALTLVPWRSAPPATAELAPGAEVMLS